jgi:hypothetical protein
VLLSLQGQIRELHDLAKVFTSAAAGERAELLEKGKELANSVAGKHAGAWGGGVGIGCSTDFFSKAIGMVPWPLMQVAVARTESGGTQLSSPAVASIGEGSN